MFMNFVKIRRKEKRLTLKQLAFRLKLPFVLLSAIESGYVKPNDRLKVLIAQALDTKIENVFPEEILPGKLKSGPGLRKAR